MISELRIPDGLANQYQVAETGSTLKQLNHVNVFIGPNNSGKSRFLRNIFSNNLRYEMHHINLRQYEGITEKLQNEIVQTLTEYNFSELGGNTQGKVKAKIQELDKRLKGGGMPEELNALRELRTFVQLLSSFNATDATHLGGGANVHDGMNNASNKLRTIAAKYATEIPENLLDLSLPEFFKVYIPILRGLRQIQMHQVPSFLFSDGGDPYKNRTIVDYFGKDKFDTPTLTNISNSLNIESGLMLYDKVKRMLLGTLSERAQIRAFESFLSRTFFESRPLSLTPKIDSDCLWITIDDEERPIYELGDGIQSIIVLLYPIFLNADKDLLCFIEEPELSLHPGFQRLFLDTILSKQFQRAQFFITTHSNHFLDMCM
jgi:AAA ATPase-like protein